MADTKADKGYRKPWNAEDDGFTTREGADIMRHGQGQACPCVAKPVFCSGSWKRWRSVSKMQEKEIKSGKCGKEQDKK